MPHWPGNRYAILVGAGLSVRCTGLSSPCDPPNHRHWSYPGLGGQVADYGRINYMDGETCPYKKKTIPGGIKQFLVGAGRRGFQDKMP